MGSPVVMIRSSISGFFGLSIRLLVVALLSLVFSALAVGEERWTVLEAIEANLRELRSPDPDVRMRSIDELRNLRPEPAERVDAHKAILRALRDEPINDERVVYGLVRLLDSWGVDIVNILAHAVKDNDQILSFTIAKTLRERRAVQPQRLAIELEPLIADARAEVRLLAIETLGVLKVTAPKALDSLRRATTDRDGRVRYRAISALLRTGDRSPATIEAIAAARHDRSLEVSKRAEAAISELFPESEGQAAAGVPSPGNAGGQSSLATTSAGEERAQPPRASLASEVTDAKLPDLEMADAKAVSPEVKPIRPETVKSTVSSEQQVAVLDSLNRLSGTDSNAPDVLANALQSPDPEVRAAAAMKVVELRRFDPIILSGLGQAIRDPEAKVRFAAGFALKQFGPAAIEPLRDALEESDPLVRFNAVQVLSGLQTETPEATSIIEGLLAADQDSLIQLQAALAVVRVKRDHKQALQTLVDALPSSSQELHGNILQSLAAADRSTVLPMLLAMTKNPAELIRREGLTGLMEIDPRSPVTAEALRILLDDKEERIRRAAAQAMREHQIVP